jgi:hypothetical protein
MANGKKENCDPTLRSESIECLHAMPSREAGKRFFIKNLLNCEFICTFVG